MRPNSMLWIHIVGDSVARDSTYINFLEMGLHVGQFQSVPEGWKTTEMMGVKEFTNGRTLIITYRTWFRCDSLEAFQAAGSKELLASVLNITDGLSQVYHGEHPWLKTNAGLSSPSHTYISLGSHSITLTDRGLDRFWSETEHIFAALNPNRLSFLLHTHVDAIQIPARYRHQDLLRNNVWIGELNLKLRRKAAACGISVIDWEGPSLGLSGKPGSFKDAVHLTNAGSMNLALIVLTSGLSLAKNDN